MARGWVLEDSEIDALELSDELKDFAREMAGESSVALTSDRENILLSAALEVELYIGKMIFRGVGGAPRVATSVVEVEAPFTVPAVGALPRSTGVTVTAVEQWSDTAEAFAPSTYIRRPLGRIRVPCAGTFRIAASVLPPARYPTVITEATARLFSYREAYKPRRNTSDLSDGNAPSIAGAMLRSGSISEPDEATCRISLEQFVSERSEDRDLLCPVGGIVRARIEQRGGKHTHEVDVEAVTLVGNDEDDGLGAWKSCIQRCTCGAARDVLVSNAGVSDKSDYDCEGWKLVGHIVNYEAANAGLVVTVSDEEQKDHDTGEDRIDH